MTSLHIFAVLGCLLIDHAFAVMELTDQTFYEYAKDKDVLLVDFYAPWCGDCKALDPDFESAANSLGTRSLDLAKVDCFGAGKALCETYGVKRWPTLKNFNRGTYTGDYNGGLTANEISGYITTVENSITPSTDPYAMVVPPPIAQACVARCKVAKITNKQPCYTKCKTTKSFGTHNGNKKVVGMKLVPPQPLINEKSCAKCRIPQPSGKRHYCAAIVTKACNEMDESVGKSGLPKNTERIMNFYINKAKAMLNFFKQQRISNGLFTHNSHEGNNKYDMVDPFTRRHKASIADHKHLKHIDTLTPKQALHVPYGRDDKKGVIAKRKNHHQPLAIKKDMVVIIPTKKGTISVIKSKKKEKEIKRKTRA